MIVFLKCFTHALGTGWYNNNSYRKARRINPGHRWKREEDVGIRGIFQGGLDSGPRVLEVVLEAQFYTRQEGGYP